MAVQREKQSVATMAGNWAAHQVVDSAVTKAGQMADQLAVAKAVYWAAPMVVELVVTKVVRSAELMDDVMVYWWDSQGWMLVATTAVTWDRGRS
jgi:hypothetical protein